MIDPVKHRREAERYYWMWFLHSLSVVGLMNHSLQIAQALGNPLQLGGLPPMLLGWEIGDPLRATKGSGFRPRVSRRGGENGEW